jgi:hypothetical protein
MGTLGVIMVPGSKHYLESLLPWLLVASQTYQLGDKVE